MTRCQCRASALTSFRRLDRERDSAVAGGLRGLHDAYHRLVRRFGVGIDDDDRVFHAGGGLKHWLVARNAGRIRAAGLRADARVYVLASGAAGLGR